MSPEKVPQSNAAQTGLLWGVATMVVLNGVVLGATVVRGSRAGRARPMEGFAEPTAPGERIEASLPQATPGEKRRASKKPRAMWAAVIWVALPPLLGVGLGVGLALNDMRSALIELAAGLATVVGLALLALPDIYPRWVKEDGASETEETDGGIPKVREWGHAIAISGATYFVTGYVATLLSQ